MDPRHIGVHSYEKNSRHPKLGTCCICEQRENVRHTLMLLQRSPIPGHGWSCNGCEEDQPFSGALAVLCDKCLEDYQNGAPLKFMLNGTRGRILYSSVPYVPYHDERKHLEKQEAYYKSEEFKKNREEMARTILRAHERQERRAQQQKQIDKDLELWFRKTVLGKEQ